MSETPTLYPSPEQTPQEATQGRLVFTPEQHPHLEFNIRAVAADQGRVVGADNPELYQALEDAHNAAQQVKEEAVQRLVERVEKPEFAKATGWDAEAVEAVRDDALVNGIN